VALLLEQEGQLAQVLGVAQRMPTGQLAVGPPPVMNERADTGAQQTDGVERLFASLRVNPDPGQPPRGEDMQPVELAGHSQSGLVRLHDGSRDHRVADGGDGAFQAFVGLGHSGQNGGIRQGHVVEARHPIGRALRRQHGVLAQMHDHRLQLRAVLHRGLHLLGKRPLVPRPAGTAAPQYPVTS